MSGGMEESKGKESRPQGGRNENGKSERQRICHTILHLEKIE